MITQRTHIILIAIIASTRLTVFAVAQDAKQPVTVQLSQTADGWQLMREGKPFFVKGVGGEGPRKLLAASGANSVRTWSEEQIGPLLDECHGLGLTVAVGIWLGHERHGFDYNNADQVAKQLAEARETIERYKRHPAVLLWGIGNEMEGYGEGDNAAIWSAVNTVASVAKKLDPHHPTMTVIAEINGQRVQNVHRLCPDIDIVGINSYSGAATMPKRYRDAGGTKPFLLTEFGPRGSWESPKTEWGAPIELTSTEKAEFYRRAFSAARDAPGLCLGGYAFIWGHKQETTSTWFGMLLPDGRRVGAADVMTELWSGRPPENRCPRIDKLRLVGAEQVKPDATVKATLSASDPDGDPLTVKWVLQSETAMYGTGGDAEEVPPTLPEALIRADATQAEFRAPKDGGGYRIFAYVDDGNKGAAVANVPLYVKGPIPPARGRSTKLPLVIYGEANQQQQPFAPSGWIGNIKAIKLDPACDVQPHSGKTCLRADYGAPDGWGGIVWQNPANDWGDQPGGWNVVGAKRLSFWARGESGGETVTFEFGLLREGKKHRDSASGKLEKVRLTTEWRHVEISLDGKDLSRIKTGFSWVAEGSGKPLTFYMDDIQFE